MSVKQRTAIKFCVLNGKNRKETMETFVKAYGDAAIRRMALHKWYSRYENVYESVMDEQRNGRPTSITSQKMMCNNPNVDHVNMNAYKKNCDILSNCSQDFELKTFCVNQGS